MVLLCFGPKKVHVFCPCDPLIKFFPILTLHGVNAHFIHHPSNVENHLIGHKSETAQPKKKEKKVHPSDIFLHLSANFWVKIQNTHCYRTGGTFSTSGQLAINGPANGSEVTYSKIQNRLSRAP